MTPDLSVTVVGAGTMGVGIAYVFALHGAEVEIVEPDPGRRDTVAAQVDLVAQGGVRRGSLTLEAAGLLAQRITTFNDLGQTKFAPHLLIEAVPESLGLKQEVLRSAQGQNPRLLATNTSSISIDSIAAGLTDASALIGMHFFNPVWVNQLVEIVVGERTRPDASKEALDLVAFIQKEGIAVRDRPGFASSRLGVLMGLEAIRMVEEGGAPASDIDRAMEVGYRHPMGPLKLTDLVGLDVRLAIAENLSATLGPRFEPPELLRSMVNEGKLGKKTGEGFYQW